MSTQTINGDRALAWGAIEAGVSVVTGYPGSPGQGTFAALAETAEVHGHQTEWAVNERVALDVAAGVSQGGRRALVCIKSVGMNVALDTLMVLNMTGVHAGLVILMGDDPGAWGSQNEQDTRPLGPLAEVPMLEPATPAEGRDMMRWAFECAERHRTVVILRITRSFSLMTEEMLLPQAPEKITALPPDREPMRWISALRTTVSNHKRLHKTLEKVSEAFNNLPYNDLTGTGPKGILAGGFAHAKLTEAAEGADLSETSILKLSALYPVPKALISWFLKQCREVLVFEEVDPYLEDAVKSVGYDLGITPPVLGKRTGHVNWEGELFRWHIQAALDGYLAGFSPSRRYTEADWEQERPHRQAHCAGCPYVEILTALREEAKGLGQNPFLAGDPGCVVMAADLLDTKLCMGSSIGVASGLEKAGVRERAVAILGDSSFYHSSLNALVHVRATGANPLIVILDNGGAVTTGAQPTPDRGLPGNASDPGPVVGIRALAEACGVEEIREVSEEDDETKLRNTFRAALGDERLNLVIVRKPCKIIENNK
jgi:indolepyruvate ferredoxin oxidoreductase, alpha subunit